MNKVNISSFFSGLLFAIGLGLSGMMNPHKVQGFLNITGNWDPSLAFVMGGAVLVTFFVFPIVLKKTEPYYSKDFSLPTKTKIDKKLVIGALLFGIGWGIAGMCPGPAIANLGSFNPEILIFIGSMVVGYFIQWKFFR
jgi:uncharacterized membrane protein YedE/YeeE